ncbi:hypothetical protein MBTS_19615 [Methylobacterium bullatum]|nr:hypothetical protein [Methylobacterium bullatum]
MFGMDLHRGIFSLDACAEGVLEWMYQRIFMLSPIIPSDHLILRCPHQRASKEPSSGRAIPGALLRGRSAAPQDEVKRWEEQLE